MVSSFNCLYYVVSDVILVVADQYIALSDTIVKNGADNVDHGVKGYYFTENGEHSWYELSKAVGRAMVELGISKSDEPTTFTTEELVKYFGSEVSYAYSALVYPVVDMITKGIR